MLDLVSLGEEIARRRGERKMTQATLAAAAGVSRFTIIALEAGRLPELGFRKVMNLLEALGADLRVVDENRGRPTLEELLEQDHA